jgi:hypothetical protein
LKKPSVAVLEYSPQDRITPEDLVQTLIETVIPKTPVDLQYEGAIVRVQKRMKLTKDP